MGLINLRGDALSWTTIASCAFAMLLFGYDQGVMSGLITADNFKMHVFGTLTPSPTISGLVVAIYEIGAFVGSISVMFYGMILDTLPERGRTSYHFVNEARPQLIMGFTGQILGRRWTVLIGQIITIIGAVLQTSTHSLSQTIAARVITGFGIGHLTSTVPLWSAEIARASYRGKAGVVLLLTAVVGLVISYWTDYGASFYDSDFSFRFPLSLQILFCVLQLITIPFLPESPRWLLARGRETEAIQIILAICDADSLETNNEAATLLADIRFAVETEDDGKSAWKEIFSMGPLQYFRRLLLAFGAQAMQQLTGINVIAYYSTVVFKQSVGMSDHLALLMGGFVSLSFLAGTFISIFIIDRMGVDHGIGFQSAPWLYGIEVTPLKLRHFAGAISSASGWIWNYAVVQVTQPGIETIGYKYFIVWAVLNFTWFWVVYFFYPETPRKTLEELDYIFMKPSERSTTEKGEFLEYGEKSPIGSAKRVEGDSENLTHIENV